MVGTSSTEDVSPLVLALVAGCLLAVIDEDLDIDDGGGEHIVR